MITSYIIILNLQLLVGFKNEYKRYIGGGE